jgi:hypothetical protein
VPPFELIAFAHLPTKKHYLAIAKGWEVDQSTFEVFQLHTQSFQFGHLGGETREDYGVKGPALHAPAALFRTFSGLLSFVAIRR